MRKTILAAAVSLSLVLSAPSAFAATHPIQHHSGGDHRPEHHQHPDIDWSAAPADIRALKAQLDQLRAEQKGLYEQMRQQRDRIKSAHRGLSEEKRQALSGEAKEQMKQLFEASKALRELKDKTHAAWDEFYKHSQAKEWTAAKKDMESIIALKREAVAKQKNVVLIQQRLAELIKK
ncbi:hypothetical protein E5161_12465 [Cohnella pontilimi]|uniref:Periplasmic heavy metal sensor n=1 Tax=Cohnella pontilimi TaxID=2564100 RepID=A0A4V5LS74_9BACL|nr:hypothetical protein [Cohnella pontilimi]TJY41999.1 hypothetical protein E5161_12465 [Cohnella pontilimi]